MTSQKNAKSINTYVIKESIYMMSLKDWFDITKKLKSNTNENIDVMQ